MKKGALRERVMMKEDVLDAAKERIRYLYNHYDKVMVNFSAGKDSTAMLYLCVEVAKELGRLPVHAIWVDHEMDPPTTIELIEKVRKMKEVQLDCYALPMELRNACSLEAPFWFPFHPLEKHLWVREPLPGSITSVPGAVFKYDKKYTHPEGLPYAANSVSECSTFQDLCDLIRVEEKRKGQSVISLIGIRARESPSRYKVMTRRKYDYWINHDIDVAYPIYDWSAEDVWVYIAQTGKPYNRDYDLQNQGKLHGSLERQRVGSALAEESLRGLYIMREAYPDYWFKVLARAQGVQASWRYTDDGVYSGNHFEKVPGVSCESLVYQTLEFTHPRLRKYVKAQIEWAIRWHYNMTDVPVPDEEKDTNPLTGLSWELLLKIAIRGDTKDRVKQNIFATALKLREKIKMSRHQAILKYGKAEYKKKFFSR